jgi:hypothetical protein
MAITASPQPEVQKGDRIEAAMCVTSEFELNDTGNSTDGKG